MHIVVVGDSIAEGLGVRGHSYAELLAQTLNDVEKEIPVTLHNRAYTALQIADTLKLISSIIAEQPDVVIVSHGITEAILRPVPAAMRYVPARWQGKGRLDPRPYFSRNRLKQLGQKLDSNFRWRLKALLMQRWGAYTWTDLPAFTCQMEQFVYTILESTSAVVILLSHTGLDETYFPGSAQSLNEYKQAASAVCSHFNLTRRVHFCDLSSTLERWDDYFADRFHPNAEGHEKIAAALKIQMTTLEIKLN